MPDIYHAFPQNPFCTFFFHFPLLRATLILFRVSLSFDFAHSLCLSPNVCNQLFLEEGSTDTKLCSFGFYRSICSNWKSLPVSYIPRWRSTDGLILKFGNCQNRKLITPWTESHPPGTFTQYFHPTPSSSSSSSLTFPPPHPPSFSRWNLLLPSLLFLLHSTYSYFNCLRESMDSLISSLSFCCGSNELSN